MIFCRTFTIICAILLLTSNAYAKGGLLTLMAIGNNQKQMEKALKQETRIYEDVKEGVEDGKITEGVSQNYIIKKYGEPVVIITEEGMEKWLYKPGYATHFDNIKIYLLFDADGILQQIEIRKP